MSEEEIIENVKQNIDKLQKEIEELKEELASKKKLIKLMQSLNLPEKIEKEYISKNKIREIVEKSYNDIDYFNRDMRKDIEDLLGE